jgi:hypothetical protein
VAQRRDLFSELAEGFDALANGRAVERRVYGIRDLPAETVEAIQKSRVNPAHDHLNALLHENDK